MVLFCCIQEFSHIYKNILPLCNFQTDIYTYDILIVSILQELFSKLHYGMEVTSKILCDFVCLNADSNDASSIALLAICF